MTDNDTVIVKIIKIAETMIILFTNDPDS
jgi:hypothetical protein